tara:strand:+ start:10532 stop:10885 length:354 start_codon:yes stop_codon:yes gene_type:complete
MGGLNAQIPTSYGAVKKDPLPYRAGTPADTRVVVDNQKLRALAIEADKEAEVERRAQVSVTISEVNVKDEEALSSSVGLSASEVGKRLLIGAFLAVAMIVLVIVGSRLLWPDESFSN